MLKRSLVLAAFLTPTGMMTACVHHSPHHHSRERARDIERGREIEHARERDRIRQVEHAREMDRLRERDRARELDRASKRARARDSGSW